MLGLSRTLPRGFHFPVLSFDAKIVPNALVTHSAVPTRWSHMAARVLRPLGGPSFWPWGGPSALLDVNTTLFQQIAGNDLGHEPELQNHMP